MFIGAVVLTVLVAIGSAHARRLLVSLRTPLGRVLGLGAARDGVSHWWTQRLSAVALVPLTLWFLISLLRVDVLDFQTARAWLTQPLHAVGSACCSSS